MSGLASASRWLGLIEFVWEAFLAIAAFMAVLDVSYFTPSALLVLYIIGLIVNLVLFVALSVLHGRAKREAAADGGFAASRGSLYFLVTLKEHLLLTVAQITYVALYQGLAPIDFTTNAGAHHVRRAIALINLVAFAFPVTGTIFEDMRFQALDAAVTRRSRPRA